MKEALSKVAIALLTASAALPSVFAQEGLINLVSREDGSGTRGAFVELVDVVDENGDDMTDLSAVIQNSTNGVMQTVAGDPNSIGYISLGSLNEDVKALTVDGVEASAETIKAGDYKIARPFNVAWKKDGLSEIAEDFLNFIHSEEGQKIVEEEGYIKSKDEATEYEISGLKGELTLVGSTSVSPVIEVLGEAYKALNPDVTISVESVGSSAGIEAANNGTADLGMASRELKEEEAENLDVDVIALDGITVIVNKDAEIEDITLENLKKVYLGEITDWADVK